MPYASKCLIEHEFNIDELNIWLTFRLPMDQTVKPAESLWSIKIDGVVVSPDSSAWQDEYTLLLICENIAASPARVLVSFAGPDPSLKTTWDKQWQPFGYILSTDLTATFLPVGTILLWSGSIATIPTGFALCNGSNGTPDLRDKFIAGAGMTYAPGVTGGAADHDHSFYIENNTTTLPAGTNIAAGTGFNKISTTHNHTATIYPRSHLPPYYALAYIMKL